MASADTDLRAQNERLLAELAESRAHQAAVGEVLQSIGTESVDLEEALFDIAERAQRLLGCDGTLLLVEDSKGGFLNLGANAPEFSAVVPVGMERLSATRVGRTFPDGAALRAMRGPIPEALRTGTTIHVWGSEEELRRRYPEIGISPTMSGEARLAVPLQHGARVLGVLTAVRTVPEPFSESQVRLLQTFATQAAIAIVNSRRLEALRESVEQQTATSEILSIISASPTDLQPVFQAVVERARRLLGSDTAVLMLRHGESARFVAEVGETISASLQLPTNREISLLESTPAARTVAENRTTHVFGTPEDIAEEYPELSVLWRQAGFERRASLVAPLSTDHTALGALAVSRDDGVPFSARQVALLETFAAQVVIAMQNARLFNDLRDSLEQQTATSEVLRAISTSPMNPEAALSLIAESAARFTGTPNIRVLKVEGEQFRLIAKTAESVTPARPIGTLTPIQEASAHLVRVVREGRTRQVDDVREHLNESPSYQAAVEHGVRSALGVPLVQSGRVVGVMSTVRTEVRPFTAEEIALFERFADQAVIAIENSRLFNELEQRNRDLAESLEQQTATADVLRVISRSPEHLDAALQAVADTVARLCNADLARVWLRDGDSLVTGPDAAPGAQPAVQRPLERRGPQRNRSGPAEEAMRTGNTIRIVDFQALAGGTWTEGRLRNRELGIRSFIAVPMLRGSSTVGALALSRLGVPRPFSDRDVALAETFAAQASIAIENARLVDELRGANRQLEAANAAKSQFLSTMSHELRTPLNAVIGYSEILAEDAADGGHEDMIPDLQRINGAGKHLLSLINNVLDISKIEAGKMELELRAFAVREVLGEVEAVVPPLMSSNGNHFKLDAGDEVGAMHSDKTKLRQCLLNLLSNAAKFTEHGTVTLAVRRTSDDAGERLSFAVSDNGIGMSEEQLGRQFQNFTQAEAGTSGRYGGTGLGLALSRQFARLMGGDITVESELGKGSTFTLTLPTEVKAPAAL